MLQDMGATARSCGRLVGGRFSLLRKRVLLNVSPWFSFLVVSHLASFLPCSSPSVSPFPLHVAFLFGTMLAIPTCILHELMPLFELLPLPNALCTWSWVVLRLNERSTSSPSLPSPVCWALLNVKDAQVQLLTDSISDRHQSWILLTCSSSEQKNAYLRWGGCGNSVEGPPWGPFPPPLFFGKKKESGRKRSSKETTYDYYGFCPDGCHTDFDAFSCCSWLYPHFVPLSLDCNMSTTANLGNKGQKKRWRFVWDVIRLNILTSDAVSSLIRIYSQSWGSAVDALNTTYPSPLPDHRVFLTVVVPCAYALASTPSGCITMLYFCTWEANWDFLSET